MKPHVAIILFLVAAWAINGEMRAQIVDDAFHITATQCRNMEQFKLAASIEDAQRVQAVTTNLATHEILYMRIRNFVIKSCSR